MNETMQMFSDVSILIFEHIFFKLKQILFLTLSKIYKVMV